MYEDGDMEYTEQNRAKIMKDGSGASYYRLICKITAVGGHVGRTVASTNPAAVEHGILQLPCSYRRSQ